LISGFFTFGPIPRHHEGSVSIVELATEHVQVFRQGQTLVAFRSCIEGPEALAAIQTLGRNAVPFEYVRMDLRDGVVRFSTGPMATFPFYVWRQGSRVHFSWTLRHACSMGFRELDREVRDRFIYRSTRYSNQTILTGVTQLTERSMILATQDELIVQLPQPYLASLPQEVISDSIAEEALVEVLEYALVTSTQDAVLELSGGHDSSLLALLPSRKGSDSFGILFDGLAGSHQAARRNMIASAQELRDNVIVGSDAIRDGVRLVQPSWDPRLDLYGPLTLKCLRDFGLEGRQVITGIGGDEVMGQTCIVNPGESDLEDQSDPMPKTFVPETALLAACSRFEFFQVAGCWPVYPYLHLEVLDFMARMPMRLSGDRTLQQRTITRLGIRPADMIKDPPENFETIYQLAMALEGRGFRSGDSGDLRRVTMDAFVDHWHLRQ